MKIAFPGAVPAAMFAGTGGDLVKSDGVGGGTNSFIAARSRRREMNSAIFVVGDPGWCNSLGNLEAESELEGIEVLPEVLFVVKIFGDCLLSE